MASNVQPLSARLEICWKIGQEWRKHACHNVAKPDPKSGGP